MSNPTNTLLAGGMAGLTVDVVLFPLDTIKTRLQAQGGFRRAGGFKGVYSGLASTATGSIPSAAIFFLVYEQFRGDSLFSHMLASSLAETASCLIRVPTEVVKQRAQTSTASVKDIAWSIAQTHGVQGFYRGFFTTLLREIPFTCVQFSLYEALKSHYEVTSPLSAAWCGSVAGVIAAGLTTPLDVLKTRWILLESQVTFRDMAARMIRTEGWSVLTHGIFPRMAWIGAGGFVFLGMYEWVKLTLGMTDGGSY
ncbi:S-adenosylmethionine transporter [Piptocephalis cylindrospora]|uniref:S-adenosylmethionine transporter n=1 Tax=Piptocephalis cylindrospora TaxID=1907219 RepID=A0A4P9Y121_9FUNG|nr:S-adenosylmethionine transporter [Piptocephalis cylindrospora]|eukprot:RKP12458.1 S-adenosylmethionine transporter [Piptocephalis cylindrospora]